MIGRTILLKVNAFIPLATSPNSGYTLHSHRCLDLVLLFVYADAMRWRIMFDLVLKYKEKLPYDFLRKFHSVSGYSQEVWKDWEIKENNGN